MALAYSFHISNKGHAITTIKKVAAASKHNLRKYKSKEYDRENMLFAVPHEHFCHFRLLVL